MVLKQGTVNSSMAPEITPGFLCGVRVPQSLVFYVMVFRSLSLCPFSFDHCAVCPSSNYGVWLLFWYLKTFS